MSQVIKQVQIEFRIKGYYLRLTHLDQQGAVMDKEPFRFLSRKSFDNKTLIEQGPEAANQPGEWVNEWDHSPEDSAYLFADPDLAAAEVKRLSELPMAIDDDNPDEDDKTKWLVPCPEMEDVLDKDYLYNPIHARFEIIPVMEVKPLHVADYKWKMEKLDESTGAPDAQG